MLEQKLKEAFYWFHQNPELSYEEYNTTAKIRELLEGEGIEILPYRLETGLAAVIRGEKEGPVQALRCDIDALPIKEESGLSYSSLCPGKMHACGHDFHITAGIGAALLLQEKKEELKGSVRILFQPGEETSLGALKMLETAACDGVERIWGVPCGSHQPCEHHRNQGGLCCCRGGSVCGNDKRRGLPRGRIPMTERIPSLRRQPWCRRFRP